MNELYDIVRPKIIHESHVELLSELCEILQLQLPEDNREKAEKKKGETAITSKTNP
jgi:hypothetical protein